MGIYFETIFFHIGDPDRKKSPALSALALHYLYKIR